MSRQRSLPVGCWIKDYRICRWMFILLFFGTFVKASFISTKASFNSDNLTTLLVDQISGNVYVGAKGFVYKLDRDLNMDVRKKTTELFRISGSCKWTINRILLITDVWGSCGILGCGDGTCTLLNISTLEPCGRSQSCQFVPTSDTYPYTAFVDQSNNEIILGNQQEMSPRTGFQIPGISSNKLTPLPNSNVLELERAASLELNRNRPKTTYVTGVVVGDYRYIFTVSLDGSSVARLCKSFKYDHDKIKTYTELPLTCVISNGVAFKKLKRVKVAHPGTKLARSFGISVSDTVVVAVFDSSAVCVYSFEQINKYISRNIDKCAKDTSIIRNRYADTNKNCQKESLYDPNCIESNAKNRNIIGSIPYEANAVVTCTGCSLSSALDVAVYQNETIAFIGTTTGSLVKVTIFSNSSGDVYENSPVISGSEIISVNLEPNMTDLYIMTTKQVVKVPVQECSKYKSCQSCVERADPYCGWCTLSAECTMQDECSDASSHLGYVQTVAQCINISSTTPEELPLSKSAHQKVNISIANLPQRTPRDVYDCFINGLNVSSRLIDDSTLECVVPLASHLPQASTATGKVSIEVAVYSLETKLKIVSAQMNFYNCTAITNCLSCTTGLLKCSWCNYEALCVPIDDVISSCPDSSVPWVNEVSAHTCPLLKNQAFYIPSNIERELTIDGVNLPKPKVVLPNTPTDQFIYKCIVTVDKVNFEVTATWNNETRLTCGPKKYSYADDMKRIVPAKIRVELGKSVIEPKQPKIITVHVYKCHFFGQSCGSCIGKWGKEYQCGWCPVQKGCVVNDACPSSSWVGPEAICRAIPVIKTFYPRTGPVAGNTVLEINGTEFGRQSEDITNVSIGGVPCRVIKYRIAESITCNTSASSQGKFSGKIKVVISGKVGYSNDSFHYQEPVISDFEPKTGPSSGGTIVNITGSDLDTGRNINVKIGGQPCFLKRADVKNNLIRCTTSALVATRRRRSTDNEKGLYVTFDGSQPTSYPSTTVFKYVPDANISNISPLYTFPSSNVPLKVTGSYLDVIQVRKLVLQFSNSSKRFEKNCDKPSSHEMICPLPDVSPFSSDDNKAQISLHLDTIEKWKDMSSYPFGIIEFVPNPYITPFKDGIKSLNSVTLEILGKNLVAAKNRDLIKFEITVGGQVCNISSKNKEIIYCKVPKESSLPKLESYDVVVNVSASILSFHVGKVKFAIITPASPKDLTMIYIIIGAVAAVVLVILIVIFCLYRRKRQQQRQSEKTFELQMTSLESKVAKECREAFAELQTDMTDFTSDLGGVGIHYFDFKNYAMRVLFPGVHHHVVMNEKEAPESPKWEEAMRTFSQLIGNRNFLLIFVKTLENQSQFKMQDRCNVASLLVIALQSKMEYCTEILQQLLAELIRKSMSKSHPKLLLRRTECVAEKLLTNWLTFTLHTYIKEKASKPLFMVYKAIKFQVEKGPIDAITNEARYSLSEDKLLRQSIEYNILTVTVEYEDNPPVQVEVLDADTISQTKEKIMDVLLKNTPHSLRISKDELDLKWVESPSNHRILKDEDKTSVIEGDWKKINTLAHYEVPDRTCLRLVRRFASPFDTSEVMQSSFSKDSSYSPTLASNQSFLRRSRNNLTEELKPWHLTKHADFIQEKDDPRHSKLLSEIYLTRLLSTKGTLQQYVDDLLESIFMTLRKNERPPLPIKFLFDFLDKQAKELNITDPEVLHTWKNNSLPLRFWVNLIKNPNFLFDVYKAPIVDSCLTVIAQLFMDACSVSEHRLGKDSPSNKLLYAKEIPAYKQKVERFYQDVSEAPSFTDDEVQNFFAAHHSEDFNIDNALKELYKYAAKYQDELQEAFEDAHFPQLASKLEHVVAVFCDD